MCHRLLARIVLAGLLMATNAGCSGSPSDPGPAPTPDPRLTVTAISPAAWLGPWAIDVVGSGFLPGATVTLDGVAAPVQRVSANVIKVVTPAHPAGTVDVVVTNANGETATLTGGFTFQAVSLGARPSVVRPGGQLTVSWEAPAGRPRLDWIALLKAGEPTNDHGWWQYTNGAAAGSFTLTAPTEPGEYEFRYLLDDDYFAVARSAVTVSASGSQ